MPKNEEINNIYMQFNNTRNLFTNLVNQFLQIIKAHLKNIASECNLTYTFYKQIKKTVFDN